MRKQITDVSMDLSPAFQKGADAYLPKAQVTFDRFHLMKLVNEAVEQVRRSEALTQPDIKKSAGYGSGMTATCEGKTESKTSGITPEPEPQDGAGLPVPPDLQDIFTIMNRHQGATL